ncbi:MAG: nitroreductase family protein [Oscillospiraceae bacterium]|nr:nitroreductase family protein [Oscillospiraceae bacterium]
MEFKELICERRSIRGYASAIGHDDLVAVLRMAQQAPSWKNQQASRCYAVETPELLEDLRSCALPVFNRNSSANAALIVTTFVKDEVGFSGGEPVNEVANGWGAYDLGLHSAYLILAARSLGYDTLIMGIRDADVIREKLSIPDNEEIMSVIAIGKRSADPSVRPRKDLNEVVRFF